MSTYDDATVKRSLLLGARIRFSPSGASVRNQAIERIIEQSLAFVEGANGLTALELQNLVTLGGQFPVLRAADVRQGIDSLKRSGRVLEIKDGRKFRYALAGDAKSEVTQIISEMEERTTAAINELFGKAPGGGDAYKRAFIRLLCDVFSKLSEVYVQIITRKKRNADLAEHNVFSAAMEEVLRSEQVPDIGAFRYGVNRFFRESTPQFDQIKWNMAQNFYVAKALGIESSSDLLSSEIFKDASLYCDTNVLIAGLTPENRHHNSFQEMAKSCNTIGMSLKATHSTLDELRGVIDAQGSMLRKVIDKIPDETRPKVRNFLLEAYLAEKETSPDLSIDVFIDRFQTPLQTLRDSFGLAEEDDKWFDEALTKQETRKLAQDLSLQYQKMRGRPKWETAAMHDAVLLLWTARENAEGRKSWVVTLDITLTEWTARKGIGGHNVVTLDAFLQWMTPVTSGSADEDRLAGIFAEAIRYQLLPRETFFQLRDFQVFADMGIETRQLPSEDVEACLREIKLAGPQLDPSKAEDREKICQVIQQYFADPGTKYKRTIQELQAQSETLSKELKEEKRRRADLEQLMRDQEKSALHKRLVYSAVRRTILALGMLIVVEAIIGYLVWQHGEGPNLLQKLTKAWPLPGVGFAIVAVLYPFLMGRDRMRLLKWWTGEKDEMENSSK